MDDESEGVMDPTVELLLCRIALQPDGTMCKPYAALIGYEVGRLGESLNRDGGKVER